MSGKRIVFTGGSGKAGRHAVAHLVALGYSRAQRRSEAARGALRSDPDRGSHRRRAGVQRAHDAPDLRRLSNRRAAAPAGRGRPFRGGAARADRARQRDLRQECDGRLQRHRSGDEARGPEDRDRLERDDLRRLFRRRRQGLPFLPARRGLRRRSDGLLRPLQGLQREDRARLRHALRSRHLRFAHRQRDRAARIRPVQAVPRRPADAQAQRLELCRRARPRRDRAALPR